MLNSSQTFISLPTKKVLCLATKTVKGEGIGTGCSWEKGKCSRKELPELFLEKAEKVFLEKVMFIVLY